jgi:PAS domain S-box-containing protein
MATILVVDDCPESGRFLVKLLGYGGHRLLAAQDGEEALKQVQAERPDLILSDMLLPTMDGLEFVRRLRAEPVGEALPVIFYTAPHLASQVRARAQALGIQHIVDKPASPEVILRTVNEALGVGVNGSSPPAPGGPSPPLSEGNGEPLAHQVDVVSGRLTALLEHGMELALQRDPEQLLANFCRAARAIMGARYTVAGVFREDLEETPWIFASGLDSKTAARVAAFPPWPGLMDTLLIERRPYRCRDFPAQPGAAHLPPDYPVFSSFLAAPIVSPARVYGWLYLMDKLGAEEFTTEDERLATILAAQVGRSYEHVILYRDIQRHAADLEREVAERKRMEAALRESEEQVRLLLDSTGEAIYGQDLQGRCTFCNRACARLLGYPDAQALLGQDMHALIHHTRPDGRPYPKAECPILQTCQRGEGAHGDNEILWRKDGTSFPAEYWSYPIRRGAELIGSVVTFLDITERKRLEEQFRQSQKMEAIGTLAGGVAHDFNNLLTIISGYSELLFGMARADDPAREFLREIKQAGERATALTRQLLAFSRKQVLAPTVLDLNNIVGEMEKMFRRLIGEDIDLAISLEEKLGPVRADPGQMEQVLLNLVVNARDAMPAGGKLTIETRNTILDASYAQSHADIKPGRYVLLAVSDTGCGMDKATLAKIFEPFFTTKGIGKGTGLGLSTVYGIVKQSGGGIQVYSEPGQGSCFKIYLPRLKEPAPADRGRSAPFIIPQGTETILLVEDDDRVRQLARMALEAVGYTILEAPNGGEALELSAAHRGPIHLLVTDVVMPQMNGRQLAAQLTSTRPDMKVLYLSGYTDDAIVRHGVLEKGLAFLQKPFTPAVLARKVREVLGP